MEGADWEHLASLKPPADLGIYLAGFTGGTACTFDPAAATAATGVDARKPRKSPGTPNLNAPAAPPLTAGKRTRTPRLAAPATTRAPQQAAPPRAPRPPVPLPPSYTADTSFLDFFYVSEADARTIVQRISTGSLFLLISGTPAQSHATRTWTLTQWMPSCEF